MKNIDKGIVFSDDIQRILNGFNAFDYYYECIPENNVIDTVRADFKSDVLKIFDGAVKIISEDEMMRVNDFIGGEYPHRIFR